MWIVRLALRRPYTFVVLAILILILGAFSILRTPTDIFPNINIPVVSIIWNYTGLNAQEMSDRIISVTERTLTTTVNDIEHIESQSLNGIAVVKIFFQPNAKLERAIAQVTAISQTQLSAIAAGNHAAADHQLQRVQRADSAAGALRRQAFRAAADRLRRQLHSHPSWSRFAGRRGSLSLRRQAAAGAGGSEHGRAAGEGLVAAGRGERASARRT